MALDGCSSLHRPGWSWTQFHLLPIPKCWDEIYAPSCLTESSFLFKMRWYCLGFIHHTLLIHSYATVTCLALGVTWLWQGIEKLQARVQKTVMGWVMCADGEAPAAWELHAFITDSWMRRWASWCQGVIWEDSLRLLSSGGGGPIRGRPRPEKPCDPPGSEASRPLICPHPHYDTVPLHCPTALQFILRLACWEWCRVSMSAHMANRITAFSSSVFLPQSGSVSSYDNSIFNYFWGSDST